MEHHASHVLLAKQPIFTKDKELFGFELLFRTPLNLNAWDVGEDQATSEVLVNYSTSVMAEADHCGSPLFINVSDSFLLSEAFLPVDKNLVVIEILERAKVTPEFVAAVKKWRTKGYRFALDDYDFAPCWDPLLPLVDFVKIDILDADLDEIARLKAHYETRCNAQWLAERIEDEDTLLRCITMGFDLFQGYVLARPKEILGNSIRASSMVTAQIIKQASDPDSSIDAISELVSRDPKLSIQLLKLINSSLFTLPREIRDLKEAITFLGIETLKKWALLIAFVADSLAPKEASRLILARAKCCENLLAADPASEAMASGGFLAGLLSGVDLLLQLDPKLFIQQMHLSPELQQALLHGEGALGKTLKTVTELEYVLAQESEKIGEWDDALLHRYRDAQHWSDEVIHSIETMH